MNFLDVVLLLIEKEGITKNKLVLDLGISRNSFNDWERRGTIPSGETLVKIADYFDVSVDYLLGRKKPTGNELNFECMELVDLYGKLNENGKNKAVEYIKDLSEQNKYNSGFSGEPEKESYTG